MILGAINGGVLAGVFAVAMMGLYSIFYGLYASVGSGVTELTLAYDRFVHHAGEARWGLIYIAPESATHIKLTLEHFQRTPAGVFVLDRCLNSKEFSPPSPKGKFLVQVIYAPDHSSLLCEKDSSTTSTPLPLPPTPFFEKHPLKIADGTYILWLGTPTATLDPPTLGNASEYLALEVETK